jgi:hypothetical protein
MIVRIEDPNVFVGLSSDDARTQIVGRGYTPRVVWADNNTLVADYKPDYDPLRVNLHIEKNRVIKATIG